MNHGILFHRLEVVATRQSEEIFVMEGLDVREGGMRLFIDVRQEVGTRAVVDTEQLALILRVQRVRQGRKLQDRCVARVLRLAVETDQLLLRIEGGDLQRLQFEPVGDLLALRLAPNAVEVVHFLVSPQDTQGRGQDVEHALFVLGQVHGIKGGKRRRRIRRNVWMGMHMERRLLMLMLYLLLLLLLRVFRLSLTTRATTAVAIVAWMTIAAADVATVIITMVVVIVVVIRILTTAGTETGTGAGIAVRMIVLR